MKISIVKAWNFLVLFSFHIVCAQHQSNIRLDGVPGLNKPNGDSIICFFPVALGVGTKATSAFGTRLHPTLNKVHWHNGIDIAGQRGSPVYAAGYGRVADCGFKTDIGYFVAIEHPHSYTTVYGHLTSYSVLPGTPVEGGTEIGRIGSTGRSTGPHLHFTVKKGARSVDPVPILLRALSFHNIK